MSNYAILLADFASALSIVNNLPICNAVLNRQSSRPETVPTSPVTGTSLNWEFVIGSI
jgi:hypothetical protein